MSLNAMSEPTHTEMELAFPMGGHHAVKIRASVVRNVALKQKFSFFNGTYFAHNVFWFHSNHFSGTRPFFRPISDRHW